MTRAGESAHAALGGALATILVDRFGALARPRTVVGIAGESGSGKSVTAVSLAAALDAAGLRAAVLHQDDYFLRPPRTNHEHRLRDLAAVGPHEVDLARVAAHVAAFRAGENGVAAPRVDYAGNRFVESRRDFAALRVLVVEGTYALTLDHLDARIFLDATYVDTRERRRARNRDVDAPIVETILEIEHRIISRQREGADVVIDREFRVWAGGESASRGRTASGRRDR
jgi:uridine kinase